MRNILVTGGAGFIGSNFVKYILQNETDARVVNLDALTYAGSLQNLLDLPSPERHVFVRGDICDRALVDGLLRRYQIDTIVPFAAETHAARSVVAPRPGGPRRPPPAPPPPGPRPPAPPGGGWGVARPAPTAPSEAAGPGGRQG